VIKNEWGAATCTFSDCGRPYFAKGLCEPCYARLRKQGSLAYRRKGTVSDRKCEVLGCGKPHHAFGRCHAHYLRFKKKICTAEPKLIVSPPRAP
jgi:hypothetical protein